MDVLEAGFPVPWKRWLWFLRTSPKKSPDPACCAARSCFTTPSQRAFKTGRDQWQGRSQRNAMYRSCKICKMPVLSSLQPVNPSYLYKLNIYIYISLYVYIYMDYTVPPLESTCESSSPGWWRWTVSWVFSSSWRNVSWKSPWPCGSMRSMRHEGTNISRGGWRKPGDFIRTT